PYHLHFLPHLHLPPLDPPRGHRAPARDRKHVLHRHQERLLHLPLRHRNALVQRRQQLIDLADPRLVPRNRLQRRPPDHRHVVPVPRAVHVRVVPVRRGVLHVARRDRQDLRRIPPPLRLRRLRHLVVRHVRRQPLVRRHLRQRRRQRRLPVVHVPNRPHVHMRLRPLKFGLGHCTLKKNKYVSQNRSTKP